MLGTNVKLSTTFHPQTHNQEECSVRAIEDIRRACIIDLRKIGINTRHLLSYPIKIVTIQLYLWILSRPCMLGDLDL